VNLPPRCNKRAHFWRGVLFSILMATAIWPLEASEKKAKVPGIYSDLHYNSEGGDLLGTEVFIVFSDANGYVAFFQCWEGGTTMPVVVPVKVEGDRISFSVPAPSLGEGKYQGSVSAAGLDGTWHHRLSDGSFSDEKIRLKRTKSYWQ
jgi:hypothetical protein